MLIKLQQRKALCFLRSGYCAGGYRHASFVPRQIKQMYIEDLNTSTFTSSCIQANPAVPLHLIPRIPITRANIVKTLLDDPKSQQCVVELEVGRYDEPDIQKVQLPLTSYLEWLMDGSEHGRMGGRQVYLAQWRGLEDVRCLTFNANVVLLICGTFPRSLL